MSLALVGINMSMKFLFIFLMTKGEERKALKISEGKSIVYEFTILFLITFLVVSILLSYQIESLSITGIVLAIMIVSIIPTYNYLIDPIVKYRLTKNNDVTEKYRYLPIINKQSIRIFESSSNVINAFATGVVPYSKTIILGKTLAQVLKGNELEAVIYHEIGHLRSNHLLKLYLINLSVNAMGMVAFVFFVQEFIRNSSFAPLWVGLYWAIMAAILIFFSSAYQRRFEKEADLFSAKSTTGSDIINALKRIDELTNGKASKKALNYPSLKNRIQHVERKLLENIN